MAPKNGVFLNVASQGKKRGLNRLAGLRNLLVGAKKVYYRKLWGMDINPTCQISLSAKFDLTYPKGVHIDEYSYVAFESRILCHDRTRGLYLHTRIGKNCFIGGRSLILPGVEIGDGCVVAQDPLLPNRCPMAVLWPETLHVFWPKTFKLAPTVDLTTLTNVNTSLF